MLLFAQAVADDARLVPVRTDPPADKGHVKVWATLDQKGLIRVVVINKNTEAAAQVRIEGAGRKGKAAVKRLQAPSMDATEHVTYAGQTYDNSADGNPVGKRQEESAPLTGPLRLRLAPASAALVTITP